MTKIFCEKEPANIENNPPSLIINYNIRLSTECEIQKAWDEMNGGVSSTPNPLFVENHKYTFNQIVIPSGLFTRDGIINAIIRDKYRIDEMEAITNNMAAINAVFMQTLVTDGIVAATKYLKESINDANTARFKEMQEWRAMAKKVASEIIKE